MITRARTRLCLLWLAGLLAAGCVGAGSGPESASPATPAATPQASLSPQIAATAGALRGALATGGDRLHPVARPYRPSEPSSFLTIPRAIFQVDLPEREQGYVVVYEFADPGTAASRGRELATHVASGFGQTNYPTDAQFAVSQAGSTLVFTWWSRERSSDPDRSQAAYEIVRRFGLPIPVRK